MFDISLGELSVIGTVALVVLGPEKLPKVAKAAGLMLGRAQRMASDFRAELENGLQNPELSELGKQVAKEEESVRNEFTSAITGIQQDLAELEGPHYHESDPELDALENRRYGGLHEEKLDAPHNAIDQEIQSLDLQRYGGSAETFSPLETEISSPAPAWSESIEKTEQQHTASTPEPLAGARHAAQQEAATIQQPDLFVTAPQTPPESSWRDRR